MVINSLCLTNKKELAIPWKTATGKELLDSLMAGSLPKTTLPTKLKKVDAVRYTLNAAVLTTVKSKTVNDDVRLQALIDGKKFVITEASIRHDLKLNDAEVSTAGGKLNAANEEPVSDASTNIATAQPIEATKTTVDITTAPKAKGIVFHDKEELTTRTASLKS
uniref:Uncharacterized protein n=1 Tax=Tanacetum cinerariifolium TaxID=118510 RepID=A0A699JNA0_TANCI|nr:hypothetical protein [Tanacetum cinerariifolium]